jgi:hypothetical protein
MEIHPAAAGKAHIQKRRAPTIAKLPIPSQRESRAGFLDERRLETAS